ncbi:hypothetical protein niasHS_008386 [Heterodera schachtii]|uniref:G-protein coupled receptors family 1 profile domain-containing protein n=1 Tax=Heterodera schachtii TaxID=97005 RepID=A0ABD2J700_HETSC
MELLLFRHEEFDKLYGCDGFNSDKIPLEERTNIVNGCILITLFFVFELLYIPCIVSIYKKMDGNACYKLMFFIGILDMLNMFVNALATGILGIIGAVYCDYPLLIYTTGALVLSLWVAQTSAEMLLAINRCIGLLRPQLAHAIFSGNKLRCLFALPICYGFAVAMFTETPLFSCPPLVYLLLNKRIRNDCANFGRAIFRFLRKDNNSVPNGPIVLARMAPNYAGNNANNRNTNNNNVLQQC